MADFLRQITLLCVAVTLLSHLLPEGSMKGAGRMVMGIVFLFMMLASLMRLISLPVPEAGQAAFALFQAQQMPKEGSYLDAVLESGERQAARIAEKAAAEAGYLGIAAKVDLDRSGAVRRVVLRLEDDGAAFPASSLGEASLPAELREAVAAAMNVSIDLIEGGSGGRTDGIEGDLGKNQSGSLRPMASAGNFFGNGAEHPILPDPGRVRAVQPGGAGGPGPVRHRGGRKGGGGAVLSQSGAKPVGRG